MRGLTKNVVVPLHGLVKALRISRYDLVLFNIGTQGPRMDSFRKLLRCDRADGILVITLPVQEYEFDCFHQINLPLMLLDGVHPQISHVFIDHAQGVYTAS